MLDDYKEAKYEYEGKMYTDYECKQMMRYQERRIRETKRTLSGLNAGIEGATSDSLKKQLKDEFEKKSVLLKSQEAKLKDICYKTGRRYESARTQVHAVISKGKIVEFNKSVSQKAVWGNRKTIEKYVQSGTIKSGQKKAYTKIKVDDIPPMNEGKFNKMKIALEKRGVSIIQNNDGDSYLKFMGAEAMTLSDGSAIIFQSGRVPSASAMYEEVIHVTQIKNHGAIGSSGDKNGALEYLLREIEANEKVLKYQKGYGLTDKDVESVQENLEMYYKRLKEVREDV